MLFLAVGCGNSNFEWHMYDDENCEVFGKQRQKVKVVSHGWKFITVPGLDNDKIGWMYNVTLKTSDLNKSGYLVIDRIEYVIYDKDNIKLMMITTNFDDIRQNNLSGSDKNKPWILNSNSTKTYRQSGFAPKTNVMNAFSGHCKIFTKKNN